MDDLIEALQIFRKYIQDKNEYEPTDCQCGCGLRVLGAYDVSTEDAARLNELSFFLEDPDDPELGTWCSERFGGAS